MRWFELLPLALLALLVFGPKRLPEVGSSIGKTIREFQKSMREVTGAFEAPPESVSNPAPAAAALPAASEAKPEPAAEPEPGVVVAADPAPASEPVSATTGAQPGV